MCLCYVYFNIQNIFLLNVCATIPYDINSLPGFGCHCIGININNYKAGFRGACCLLHGLALAFVNKLLSALSVTFMIF